NNTNPHNIRNKPEHGGGAIWDIGCYPVFTARTVLGEEPLRLVAAMEKDPQFGTDRLSSVIAEFPSARLVFTVSTQLVPYQRMQFFGDQKELEVRIPFNAPPDKPCEIHLRAEDIFRYDFKAILYDTFKQYMIQEDAFTEEVKDNTEVPISLVDAKANAGIWEAIYHTVRENREVEL